jgi:alkylated DNA repair dioxygenase AlkB
VTTYLEDFILDQDRWFDTLRDELDWERREGVPRSEYWNTLTNTPYTYGRGQGIRTYLPHPPHWVIHSARVMLQIHVGTVFHGCFLNMYEDGKDHLGWHADDDAGIDHTAPIAIITLGHGRELQWRRQNEKGQDSIQSEFLKPGSLFLMQPGMQKTHFHRIPKAQAVTGPRISMTFRKLV